MSSPTPNTDMHGWRLAIPIPSYWREAATPASSLASRSRSSRSFGRLSAVARLARGRSRKRFAGTTRATSCLHKHGATRRVSSAGRSVSQAARNQSAATDKPPARPACACLTANGLRRRTPPARVTFPNARPGEGPRRDYRVALTPRLRSSDSTLVQATAWCFDPPRNRAVPGHPDHVLGSAEALQESVDFGEQQRLA